MKSKVLIPVLAIAFFVTGCSNTGGGYGGFLGQQLEQGRGYQFSTQTADISGPSNRVLQAAEYRSNLQANTTINMARAQHAELGVVDHKLDTARRASSYDHKNHMEKNTRGKDDFRTIESITSSVSSTGSNIDRALSNFANIFK